MSCCTTDNIPRETAIIDYQVGLLIAAGAAMAANCEPCLNKAVPDLIEAGVSMPDIRKALEIGQFVKDKPASLMREAADMLAGTHLTGKSATLPGCPLDAMKPGGAVS